MWLFVAQRVKVPDSQRSTWRMTEIDDCGSETTPPLFQPPCVVALSPGVSSCGPHAESAKGGIVTLQQSN